MPDRAFALDPDAAIAAATRLGAAAAALASLHREIGQPLVAAGAQSVWGHDQVGQACQRNYDALGPPVLAAWPQIAECLETVGGQVIQAVAAALSADATASADFDGGR